LSKPNMTESQQQRKQMQMVRDLEEWKNYQETKVKKSVGENMDLINRIFRYKEEEKDVLEAKYKEYLLRQRITPKELIRDLFQFEKEKNKLVLSVFEGCDADDQDEVSSNHDLVNGQRASQAQFNKAVHNLEEEIEINLRNEGRFLKQLKDRKDAIKRIGGIGKLRHIFTLKHALMDHDERPSSPQKNLPSSAEEEERPLIPDEVKGTMEQVKISDDSMVGDKDTIGLPNQEIVQSQELPEMGGGKMPEESPSSPQKDDGIPNFNEKGSATTEVTGATRPEKEIQRKEEPPVDFSRERLPQNESDLIESDKFDYYESDETYMRIKDQWLDCRRTIRSKLDG
jgi:hypothetical protein